MTPVLRHLPALNAAFEFPNEALSFFVSVCMSACVFYLFNHHIALSLCKHSIYLRRWRPEMPVAYEVEMATARCTQACFHAAGTHTALQPQGGMLGK